MDQESIDGFARRFLASGKPLHILINNAAIMGTPLLLVSSPPLLIVASVPPRSERAIRSGVYFSSVITARRKPSWASASPDSA